MSKVETALSNTLFLNFIFIVLIETWLTDNFLYSEIELVNYNICMYGR